MACVKCDGSGFKERVCKNCYGSGSNNKETDICEECLGEGYILISCPTCHGYGELEEE